MKTLDSVMLERWREMQTQHLDRTLHETLRADEITLTREGRDYISFSCNNYLGLAQHPYVIAQAQEALAEHGASGAASRLVTGNHPLHTALEKALAAWKGYPGARVFGSGYLANLGVLSTLMGPNDLILLDRLAHACLLDGAKLSGARWMRFKHNDMEDLQRLLMKHRSQYRHCLIVSETIFSMDGDRAPTTALAALAATHDAWWMLDDAHGLGEPVTPAPDVLVGTLSKALGSYGGFVAASEAVIETLTSSARSLLFTTALPPATLAAAAAALRILQNEPERRARALEHAQFFTRALGLANATSQIVPLMIGEAHAALQASQQLQALGFLVSAIRPPTVPAGTARLRVSFSSAHSSAQLEQLTEAICSTQLREIINNHV
ncbi:MAG: aminotransferase class I/II-fold pyridoxal phosphate-dependent enzyme [Rickettsiales bacterium]|nr:aminotransferase class I/II-fold pyridoxal phosphate-dependent enzyme [Rickettsiales bacterium]